MERLDESILRCKVSLKRDASTLGDGNCFPRSIIQQCERYEVRKWLEEHRPWKIASSHNDLRLKVVKFALNESNEKLNSLKDHYENVQIPLQMEDVNNPHHHIRSWREYWRWMSQDSKWADDIFIQATAWYLELDIKIITFTSTPKKPFMTISGGDDSSDFRRPKLYVGYIPVRDNEHYQSLLPKDENKNLSTLKRGINQVDNDNGSVAVLRL